MVANAFRCARLWWGLADREYGNISRVERGTEVRDMWAREEKQKKGQLAQFCERALAHAGAVASLPRPDSARPTRRSVLPPRDAPLFPCSAARQRATPAAAAI